MISLNNIGKVNLPNSVLTGNKGFVLLSCNGKKVGFSFDKFYDISKDIIRKQIDERGTFDAFVTDLEGSPCKVEHITDISTITLYVCAKILQAYMD